MLELIFDYQINSVEAKVLGTMPKELEEILDRRLALGGAADGSGSPLYMLWKDTDDPSSGSMHEKMSEVALEVAQEELESCLMMQLALREADHPLKLEVITRRYIKDDILVRTTAIRKILTFVKRLRKRGF